MIHDVRLTRRAAKQLTRLPRHVVQKLLEWMDVVEVDGLEVARRVPGYHDEPLKGQRGGERSIRLSRSYRAVYTVVSDGVVGRPPTASAGHG